MQPPVCLLVFHVILADLVFVTSEATDEVTDVDLGEVKSEHLGNLCSRTVIVKSFLDLEIKFLHGSWNCSVEFVPHSEKTILKAFFRKYESSPACSGPIYLYDSLNQSLLGDRGYCRAEPPRGYFHLDQRGTISVTRASNSIDALVRLVEYSIKDIGCPSDSFDCETQNLCINKDIQCDFSSDCPNGRDEANDCAHDKLVPVYILAVVIVTVCTCCICGTILWEETRSRHKGTAKSDDHHQMPFDGVYVQNLTAQKGHATHACSPKLEEVNAQLAKLSTFKTPKISQVSFSN